MSSKTLPLISVDRWLALAMAAAFFGLYLRTLCPTVYLGDSGEICTAIATGGIIHPPGYPLFSLLGRWALWLIPWGEPAFRIGCLVALAAALALPAVYLLARELGAGPWAAAAGTGIFGASYTFWSQSVRVEVYSLHVLLATLLLLGALRYRRTGQLGDLCLAVLAGSLGLAHHLTIALLAPVALLLCSPRLWKDPGLARRLAACAALLPIGPSLYLLLMVWARAEPVQAWGNPVTLGSLWNHMSARLYRNALKTPFEPDTPIRLAYAGQLLADNFPYLLWLLAVLGAWALWKRDRWRAATLLFGAGSLTLYNVCYHIFDIAGYYLVVWAIGAGLLAVGLEFLHQRFRAHVRHPMVGGLILLLLCLLPLARNWWACDLSRVTWVREFSRQKLECVPRNGVLICQGDADTFPLWYAQGVLGVRPDVLLLDRGMTTGTWKKYRQEPSLWYLLALKRKGVNVSLQRPRHHAELAAWARDGYLIQLLQTELRGRPLCITFGATSTHPQARPPAFLRWVRERFELLPVGIVLRLQPRNEPVDLQALIAENDRLWARIQLPDLAQVRTDQEISPNYLAHHYACMLVNYGGLRELAGDLAGAAAIYRRAAEWAPAYQPATQALTALQRQTTAQRGPT